MEKTNNNIPTAEELAIYIKEATVLSLIHISEPTRH